MDLRQLDKKILKSVIKEILSEDVSLLKDIIRDLFIENKIITKEQEQRRKEIESIINADFEKYDNVFQALAR